MLKHCSKSPGQRRDIARKVWASMIPDYLFTVIHCGGVSIHHQIHGYTFKGSKSTIFGFALRVDLIALLSKLSYLFGY